MEFISTKDMTNENAPEGMVLVKYLEPSWGRWSLEYGMGYYDNPLDYGDPDAGEGWKHWNTENKINVIAYAHLPEKGESPFGQMTQQEFKDKFGSFHPNLGNAGQLET